MSTMMRCEKTSIASIQRLEDALSQSSERTNEGYDDRNTINKEKTIPRKREREERRK